MFQNVLKWLEAVFTYPVPDDYMTFLREGDFESTVRKFYVDIEEERVFEISEWFAYDDIMRVFQNCREEGMIEEYHLPIMDSCGCTIVINCNPLCADYGKVFSRTPTGYYDEKMSRNIYLELDLVAESFDQIISNLKTEEELDEFGL